MCLLTFLEEGVMPDCTALHNGTYTNDDGHGFAIVDPHAERIIVRKGMDGEKMIELFEKMRKQYPYGPAIFHSRFTTDGVSTKYNIHPFEVNGYTKTVLAHNGIFPNEARPKKGDIRSDTRIVAAHVSGKYGFPLETRQGRRLFGTWMGSGNKVVILTLDPRFSENAYIINEHLGSWVGDIWYSNSGYKPTFRYGAEKWYEDYGKETYTGTTAYQWKDGKYVEYADSKTTRQECDICLTQNAIDPVMLRCTFCKCCHDCKEPEDACQCWPTVLGDKAKAPVVMCGVCSEELPDCFCVEFAATVAHKAIAATPAVSETGWPHAPKVA